MMPADPEIFTGAGIVNYTALLLWALFFSTRQQDYFTARVHSVFKIDDSPPACLHLVISQLQRVRACEAYIRLRYTNE